MMKNLFIGIFALAFAGTSLHVYAQKGTLKERISRIFQRIIPVRRIIWLGWIIGLIRISVFRPIIPFRLLKTVTITADC